MISFIKKLLCSHDYEVLFYFKNVGDNPIYIKCRKCGKQKISHNYDNIDNKELYRQYFF